MQRRATTAYRLPLYPWQVEAIFHGLKQAKCRVVWGLKEAAQAHLPSSTDPDFYISKWIPQAALLQDSTLECVVASKPIVAIPFFGDQPENANLLVGAGAGEYIGKVPAGGMDMNPYKEGDFTAKTVATAVAKIMANPDYTKAVAKMAKSSRASGGAEAAAQQIEWAARFGTCQLHYPLKRTNPLSGLLLAAAGFAALVGYRLVRK
ncbi:hypothetical protein EMIHUDRAFT_252162 [Emiliania huxleyi CCMP1516]|uniref:Glucuronosyltransferase n=2 Tax=Emiliania huxleyi TaxID=2903 RepID=A0A0D3KN70_EMIH1|nr:hypothetical protein EMIHUDRAFT_252162 [Emiliania huxleyi CCMP1516]EOD37205.1 hypothetical protein EMIHUDRAFT_252162 [Emiliania huxleyi CCMP1516]|eukprot:XP_005789634.1 hypothetical protein EMIHUDRAFT_252162 [Emiliania huxleyi CCMP1516]